MYRSILALAVASAMALTLTGCATSSPDVISRQDAQRMSTVTDATVLSVRPVTVDGSQSGAGAMTGGLVGGIAGASMGSNRNSGLNGLIGAVAGALVGNVVERTGTREESLEIMVQLRNGERRAIVQAKGNENFVPGDPVILVSTGSKVRVSRAPQAVPLASPPLPLPVAATRS